MPAHSVYEATVPSITGSSSTRVDNYGGLNTNFARRYKITIVNPSSSGVRLYVGFSSGVTALTGVPVEADKGDRDFFVDSSVTVYVIADSGQTVSNVPVKEHGTA